MPRKRASLAGRGVEILFGGEPQRRSDAGPGPDEVDSTASEAEEPLVEQPASERGGEMDAEWAAMLEAEAETATVEDETEARAMEPEARGESAAGIAVSSDEAATAVAERTAEDGRPDWPVVEGEASVDEVESQPEPEVEEELPRFATTPVTAARSATPGPETPPSPMYSTPSEEEEGASAPLPAPRAKPEAYDPVVRTRLVGALSEAQTEAPPEERLRPDGPTTAALELREPEEWEAGQPTRVRREREVLGYVGTEQRQALWDEVTDLYKEVPDVLCTDELQDEALQLLQEAQDILMEKPRQFDVAQYKVGQVQSIVIRRKNTIRWTNTYGWATFAYETLWIVALGAAILFGPSVVAWVGSIGGEGTGAISVAELWNTAAWGSVGGVLGALYSLYWHAAKVKDFDKQYVMWYVVQPVIGVIIGAMVYVIIGAGVINIIGETASGGQTPLHLFPYAVACISGFRQRFILEVVDRFIQFLTGAASKPEAKPVGAMPQAEPPAPVAEG